MDDLHVGHGPYYGFFRPYHLTSLEVPLSCARIMLYGKADMVPLATPVAEVCAVAKRDLKPGERLDAIGETCYRSYTMTAVDARAEGAVPVGLLEGGRVLAAVRKGRIADAGERRAGQEDEAVGVEGEDGGDAVWRVAQNRPGGAILSQKASRPIVERLGGVRKTGSALPLTAAAICVISKLSP